MPEGTVLAAGIVIYSDAACSVPIGTIDTKGVITSTSTSSYYYKITYSTNGNVDYLYTISALNPSIQVAYSDSACTSRKRYTSSLEYVGTMEGTSYAFWTNSSGASMWGTGFTYQLLSTTSEAVSSVNYITLQGSSTKLAYYKQADTTGNVIKIDDGVNESYILTDNIQKSYIKIGAGSYQAYEKTDTIETLSIKIADGTLESYVDNGITSSQGVVYAYKTASNGHKIIDNKYINQLTGDEGYYILKQSTREVTLPILDENKVIYFVAGTNIVIPSITTGITRNDVLNLLESYVRSDSTLVVNLQGALSSFNIALNSYSSTLATTIASLNNVYTKSETNNLLDMKADKTTVSTISTSITNLENTTSTLSTGITSLTSTQVTMQTDIATIQSTVTTLNTTYTSTLASINTALAEILGESE